MKRVIVGACVAVLLASCATPPAPGSSEEPIWFRADCKRISGNADLERQFELSKDICLNRGAAAGVASTASLPVGYGTAGAISSGMQRGLEQASVEKSTTVSCMAEQGYMLRTRAEFAAFCPSAK